MSWQILWGGLVVGIGAFIHIAMILGWAVTLKWIETKASSREFFVGIVIPVTGTFLMFLLAHTLMVWLWAGSFIWLGALTNVKDAVYFSLVTYTTVGYGDVTLSNDFKIFGAMASVSGLLNFSVSTAFFLAILTRLVPEHLRDK